MVCLSDLMDLDHDWKYALNMAGSELMLATNKELIRNLSAFPDDDIYVNSFHMPDKDMYRVRKTFHLDPSSAFDPDHAGIEFVFV